MFWLTDDSTGKVVSSLPLNLLTRFWWYPCPVISIITSFSVGIWRQENVIILVIIEVFFESSATKTKLLYKIEICDILHSTTFQDTIVISTYFSGHISRFVVFLIHWLSTVSILACLDIYLYSILLLRNPSVSFSSLKERTCSEN